MTDGKIIDLAEHRIRRILSTVPVELHDTAHYIACSIAKHDYGRDYDVSYMEALEHVCAPKNRRRLRVRAEEYLRAWRLAEEGDSRAYRRYTAPGIFRLTERLND
jgi:hypothetical protein